MAASTPLARIRTTALETLWFVACTVALTWPTALQPSAAVLGSQHADGMKHLWTLWWIRASVWREGAFPFQTELVNYPVGMELATFVAAALARPRLAFDWAISCAHSASACVCA